MDQDSTARKFAHEEILHDFAAGKANVLLGTQMVAKGHDIANVTLVGILAADSQLNLPDFRAGEKTFNLVNELNTDLTVMGPFPGIVEKVRDLYRINILVKSTHMAVVKNSLKTSEFREMKNVYFDVDPISVV